MNASDDADESLTWWTNPYPPVDWLRVVYRNARQHPHTKHRGLTKLIPTDAVIDPSVTPEVSIAFVGDIMPIQSKGFRLCDELAAFLSQADWLVGNLEGVLWPGQDPPPKVFMAQHHPNLDVLNPFAELVPAERLILSMANNHAADFGARSLAHTVAEVEQRGHRAIGTVARPGIRLGPNDETSFDPAHSNRRKPINLTALTQWTNRGCDYLPFLDQHADYQDDADVQLLYAHWGLEMETHPRPATVSLGDALLRDWHAIIGHHPHVPSTIALRPGEPGAQDRPVAYSLGQAASDIPYRLYHRGQVARLRFGPKPDGRWAVGDISWRFLRLDHSDPETIVARLRPTDSWFPESNAPTTRV